MGLLSPEEKSELLDEARGLFDAANLSKQERWIMEGFTGASEGYRYTIAQLAAIHRKSRADIEQIVAEASKKIRQEVHERLTEIALLLSADFPDRE